MPRDKDFKRQVRARMRETGENYTQARRALHPFEARDAKFEELPALYGSSSVVVWQHGKRIFEWFDAKGPRPTELMSITKLVVGFAVCAALRDEGVAAMGRSLANWYPEWKGTAKERITLGQLLGHYSGLEAPPSSEVYAAPDALQRAIDAELVAEPGRQCVYNNLAPQLAGGVVERVSGIPLDAFCANYLFAPLNITQWRWQKDSVGHPLCLAGLWLRADDLVKIGQSQLDDGAPIISEDWARVVPRMDQFPMVRLMMATVLWERAVTDKIIDMWQQVGVPPETLAILATIKDEWAPEPRHLARVRRLLGEDRYQAFRAIIDPRPLMSGEGRIVREGYGHTGDLGQYMSIMPDIDVVAVRQRDWDGAGRNDALSSWPTFNADVWAEFAPDTT